MELTSENMKFIFDKVSAELGQAASAEPRAKARSRGSDASGSSEEDSTTLSPPAKRRRGITWLSTRSTWVVRYKDAEGRCRSKCFRASPHLDDPCGNDDAQNHAFRLAEPWLEEYLDAAERGF